MGEGGSEGNSKQNHTKPVLFLSIAELTFLSTGVRCGAFRSSSRASSQHPPLTFLPPLHCRSIPNRPDRWNGAAGSRVRENGFPEKVTLLCAVKSYNYKTQFIDLKNESRNLPGGQGGKGVAAKQHPEMV